MPHMLFYGPPGTGKTSSAHALARELFGNDWKSRVLELNASDDRGIAVVREKIKTWTRSLAAPIAGAPDWKIVVLDEADMMTQDAQSALRRIIEDTSRHTRFVITCNYLSRIIEPISSRLARHRFEPVSREAQRTRLKSIAEAEGLVLGDSTIDAAMDVCCGDLRVGITLLQTAASFDIDTITEDTIFEIAGRPPERVVRRLLQSCTSESCHSLEEALDDIAAEGWDVNQLFKQLNVAVVTDKYFQLSDIQKAEVTNTAAMAHFRLQEGANEALQLTSVVMKLHQCWHDKALQ
eukprot:Polyplicarium_translucidae@DN3026_c0_g2_i1.p2